LAYSKSQQHAMLDVLRDELTECESVDSENNRALSES